MGFIACNREGVREQPAHRGCDVVSGHLCSIAGAWLNGKAKAKQLLCCENKEENSGLRPSQGSIWDAVIGK